MRGALAGDDMWFFTDEVRNPIEVDVLAAAILELVAREQTSRRAARRGRRCRRPAHVRTIAGDRDGHEDASALRGGPAIRRRVRGPATSRSTARRRSRSSRHGVDRRARSAQQTRATLGYGLVTLPRPPGWISKCRCGTDALPVWPTAPMTAPALTAPEFGTLPAQVRAVIEVAVGAGHDERVAARPVGAERHRAIDRCDHRGADRSREVDADVQAAAAAWLAVGVGVAGAALHRAAASVRHDEPVRGGGLVTRVAGLFALRVVVVVARARASSSARRRSASCLAASSARMRWASATSSLTSSASRLAFSVASLPTSAVNCVLIDAR